MDVVKIYSEFTELCPQKYMFGREVVKMALFEV
jgi:hypothetical protein